MGKKQEINQLVLTPILDLSQRVEGYGIRVSSAKLFEYLNQIDQEWYSIGITEDSQRMLVIVEKDGNEDYPI
jgi:hypothetical protein